MPAHKECSTNNFLKLHFNGWDIIKGRIKQGHCTALQERTNHWIEDQRLTFIVGIEQFAYSSYRMACLMVFFPCKSLV